MRSCRPAPTLDRPLNGAAPHIICGKKKKKGRKGEYQSGKREEKRTEEEKGKVNGEDERRRVTKV